MKQALTAVIGMVSVVFCLALLGAKSQAQSVQADNGNGPVTLTASLAGSSTVALGGPILLKYVVRNTAELPVSVSVTGTPSDTLGTESFTGVDGKPLVPSVSLLLPQHKSESFIVEAGVDIAGNSSRSWEAFTNARITFPHPGHYLLRVHVERPYVAGDPERGTGYVLKGDYAFPLTVVEANPAELRHIADRLRAGILGTTDDAVKAPLIQALFSMPELAASSSWQALITEPKMDGKSLNEIGTALEGLQTNRTADLLAEMLWASAQPSNVVAEASITQHFDRMYDAATPAVKRHIEDLYKQYGVPMSRFRIE